MTSSHRSQNTQSSECRDIAIIGMACMFPGAPDLASFWRNIVSGVDAVTDPPPEAWDSDRFYDPEAPSVDSDRVYCKRGGYLGPLAHFDPMEHGVPPMSVGGEPDQWLALKVAREALADAGYPDGPSDGSRTAVILGKGTYLNRGNFSWIQHGLVVDQTIQILSRLHPELGGEDLDALREEFKRSLPPVNPETVPGLVPNIIAGRIANRLNLMGPSYTVDAACASSLLATEQAMHDLVSGKCDLAITGGSQITTPVPVFNLFCQLNALSRREEIRPFDKDADGTILGEGIGMLVLKRRDLAEQDGDRIYARIKGVGTSSDGRGVSVMAPRLEGETLALERALETAQVPRESIGLIEAHGTATAVGDVVEIRALTQVYGPSSDHSQWCALGSVKSMIGHTLPAAGAAGLIKTALALYHKLLPPTLHCDQPNPELELERTPFYINTTTRPWIHPGGRWPRRAGVNAFGFGGVNSHVILEEHTGAAGDTGSTRPAALPEASGVGHSAGHLPWDSEVCILQGDTRQELVTEVQRLRQYLTEYPEVPLADLAFTLNTRLREGSSRLAVVASSVADLDRKLSRAEERLSDPDCHQIKDRNGIYYFESPLSREGRLVFLFPGEAAQYPNMLADLCLHFPEVRECFDRMDRVFEEHPRGYLSSEAIFPRPTFSEDERKALEERLWQMEGALEGVLTANMALFRLLRRLGVKPDVILGHSAGEYSAVHATGILDLEDETAFREFALELNRMHREELEKEGIPAATLLAVGTDRRQAEEIVRQVGGELYVAMDNCPHQVVLVGEDEAARRAEAILQERSLIYQVLPFNRAYHTPHFRGYLHGLGRFFHDLPVASPDIEAWSCTTQGPYPGDEQEIRTLLVDHWASRVEFTSTIRALYEHGVRTFVEVGPRGNLTSFVEDILRGQPHVAIATNIERRTGIAQLNHTVGMLSAQGLSLDLSYLYQREGLHTVPLYQEAPQTEVRPRSRTTIKLPTGWPTITIADETVERVRTRLEMNGKPSEVRSSTTAWHQNGDASGPAYASPAEETAAQPLLAHLETMNRFLETQQEVMQAFLGHAPSSPLEQSSSPSWPQQTRNGQQASTETAQQPSGNARDAGALSGEQMQEAILAIVCERTGYPTEMLGLDMDMEGDLGIDSIKRVEILGTFRQRYGIPRDEDIESIRQLKTLREVLDFLARAGPPREEPANGSRAGRERSASSTVSGVRAQEDPDPVAGFPLLDRVESLTPGEELVAASRIHWDEHLYLHDHTLGYQASADPTLHPLAVMPLTMSMELMAEAGAALLPDRVLTGMREVRGHRWIALEDDALDLRVVARSVSGVPDEVHVQVFEEPRDGTSHEGRGAKTLPVAEATVVFGEGYPERPHVAPPALEGQRPSRWNAGHLYTPRPDEMGGIAMFHGPRWRGVASLDAWGENGTLATLQMLPFHEFFRSNPRPAFVTDPVVLDAVGQMVGFWAMEHLERGYLVFPYRLRELQLYRSPPATGTTVRCQANITLVGNSQVTTDFDVLDTDGLPWMRLVGWEDKRFDLPWHVYQALLSPGERPMGTRLLGCSVGEACDPRGCPFHAGSPARCLVAARAFQDDPAFWTRVWAHLVLSRSEREEFRRLPGAEAARAGWLASRIVAKDAVFALAKEHYNHKLRLADIEIRHDENGRPIVGGPGVEALGITPSISLAHSDRLGAALVGFTAQDQVPGVDAEPVHVLADGFDSVAFTQPERALLEQAQPEHRNTWSLRLWCAKEAAGKALGHGLIEGPGSVQIADATFESGLVRVVPTGSLAQLFPHLVQEGITVHTRVEDDVVIAATLCR